MVALRGGPSLACLSDLFQAFPEAPPHHQPCGDTKANLETVLARLDSTTLGAVFMPMMPNNPGGDFYGMFRKNIPVDKDGRAHYCLVEFQAKDWFVDNSALLLEEWRKTHKHITSDAMQAACVQHNVEIVHILLTANPSNIPPEDLRDNEGIMDLVHMRSWLPTAAYAAESAHKIRRLFRPDFD